MISNFIYLFENIICTVDQSYIHYKHTYIHKLVEQVKGQGATNDDVGLLSKNLNLS